MRRKRRLRKFGGRCSKARQRKGMLFTRQGVARAQRPSVPESQQHHAETSKEGHFYKDNSYVSEMCKQQ